MEFILAKEKPSRLAFLRLCKALFLLVFFAPLSPDFWSIKGFYGMRTAMGVGAEIL
jgi:hypothetical protein